MRTNDKIGGGVYMCNAYRNHVNALLKHGSYGGKTPSQRLGTLRNEHTNIEMVCYLPLPQATKAEYEAVEHHVKMVMLRQFPELSHIGNDHFGFTTNKDEHKKRVQFYCNAAMNIAIAYCVEWHIPHEAVVYPNYKKGGVHYGKRG